MAPQQSASLETIKAHMSAYIWESLADTPAESTRDTADDYAMSDPDPSDLTRAALLNAEAQSNANFVEVREDAREAVERECRYRATNAGQFFDWEDLYWDAVYAASEVHHYLNSYGEAAAMAENMKRAYRYAVAGNPVKGADGNGYSVRDALNDHRDHMEYVWSVYQSSRADRDRFHARAFAALARLRELDDSTWVE